MDCSLVVNTRIVVPIRLAILFSSARMISHGRKQSHLRPGFGSGKCQPSTEAVFFLTSLEDSTLFVFQRDRSTLLWTKSCYTLKRSQQFKYVRESRLTTMFLAAPLLWTLISSGMISRTESTQVLLLGAPNSALHPHPVHILLSRGEAAIRRRRD